MPDSLVGTSVRACVGRRWWRGGEGVGGVRSCTSIRTDRQKPFLSKILQTAYNFLSERLQEEQSEVIAVTKKLLSAHCLKVRSPGEDIGGFLLSRSLELLSRGNEIVSRERDSISFPRDS